VGGRGGHRDIYNNININIYYILYIGCPVHGERGGHRGRRGREGRARGGRARRTTCPRAGMMRAVLMSVGGLPRWEEEAWCRWRVPVVHSEASAWRVRGALIRQRAAASAGMPAGVVTRQTGGRRPRRRARLGPRVDPFAGSAKNPTHAYTCRRNRPQRTWTRSPYGLTADCMIRAGISDKGR
jgi:hypothetical protein